MADTYIRACTLACREDGGTFLIMSDADVAEVLKLPAAERLRLVELIWKAWRPSHRTYR